jgi:hypothetical protein
MAGKPAEEQTAKLILMLNYSHTHNNYSHNNNNDNNNNNNNNVNNNSNTLYYTLPVGGLGMYLDHLVNSVCSCFPIFAH